MSASGIYLRVYVGRKKPRNGGEKLGRYVSFKNFDSYKTKCMSLFTFLALNMKVCKISAQSSDSIVFRLQPVYFLSSLTRRMLL